ncbi:MAG TPA: hypothetical protein VF896_09865 [Anaerolineales bacterium]
MKNIALPILFLLTLILAACVPSQPSTGLTTPEVAPVSNNNSVPTNRPASSATSNGELARTDEQGAVVFQITPLNLDTATDTLEFDVAMNTHSVDLGMDLASLSTLSTDTGVAIPAAKWDATPGGHHVDGKLIFPLTANGKSILDGASKLTLTIINVDAASRVFEWELK